VFLVAAVIWAAATGGWWTDAAVPPEPDASRPVPRSADERIVTEDERQDALRRARAWREPAQPIEQQDLRAAAVDDVECRFRVTRVGGTTPKFDCTLVNGEQIRVKYGNGAEIPAEAAGTRLVRALGFGADTITLVKRLRCYGCPVDPFATIKTIGLVRAGELYSHTLDYEQFRDYEWVAMERKFDGKPIESAMQQGWAFFELDRLASRGGGAPRAHLDALKLLAVFLAHWDNKADNQRLVCESRNWPEHSPCPAPLLVLQDLGATFGPRKVDLEGWSQAPIWDDRKTCQLTMRGLPYDGATFSDTRVGEEGRQLLARLLGRISDAQATDLFDGARFDEKRGLFSDIRPVEAWVHAFKARVAAITDGKPCPSP
jgi:hypothetical protein